MRDESKDAARGARAARVILALAVAGHAALHLPPALLRREIHHDEGITLLAITGHQGEYDAASTGDAPPNHTWAPAGDWKRMLVMDKAAPPLLGLVSKDLARLDIHPPLYFWLLSLVARALGASLGTGLVLDFGLDVLTIAALFLFAKKTVRDPRVAAIAALLWAVSPGALDASLEMRQYALLGLFVTLFALFTVKSIEPERPPSPLDGAALAGVAALGMATHYHFLLVLVAGAIVAARALWKTSLGRACAFVTLSAIGAAGGLAAHPYVLTILKRQEQQAEPFVLRDLGERCGLVLLGASRFFVSTTPLVVAFLLGLVAALVFVVRAPAGSIKRHFAPLDPAVARALSMGGLIFAAQAALLLTFRSPSGAMRAKYMVLDYPFFACSLAWALTRPSVHRLALRLALSVSIVSSLAFSAKEIWAAWQVETSKTIATSARRIVFDTTARGSLPVALFNVPDGTPVFAASQSELLARKEDIAAGLEPGSLVVFDPPRGTPEGRAELLRFLEQRYHVEQIRPDVFRNRITYRLSAR